MRYPTTGIIAAWFATIAIACAATEGWTSDWQGAKDRSKAEGKPILLYMTGSDWCGWCKKLEKEVISQPAFMDFAKRHFVLMEADYPRKKEQPPELKKQNAALGKTYLAGGYPTMWVLDAAGNKLSKDLGELKGGVDGYITTLKEFLPKESVRAFIDDTAPGFRDLTEADFAKVNSADDTWTWKDGVLHCTGQPVSVLRSAKPYTNFETRRGVDARETRRQLRRLRVDHAGIHRKTHRRRKTRAARRASKCRSSTTRSRTR